MASGPIRRQLRRSVREAFAATTYSASSVDAVFFVNASKAPLYVRSVTLRPTTAGTSEDDVEAVIVKVPNGSAISAGTAVHATPFDLTGTAATNQVATASAEAANGLVLAPGDSLAIDFTGTLTGASGVVVVDLIPA